MIVADASATIDFLLAFPGMLGAHLDPQTEVHVPELHGVEVLSALRRLVLRGTLSAARAEQALADCRDLAWTRHPHTPLLHRAFELRDNFSAYDAVYVALAEGLGARLATTDAKLAEAVRAHGFAEVIGP